MAVQDYRKGQASLMTEDRRRRTWSLHPLGKSEPISWTATFACREVGRAILSWQDDVLRATERHRVHRFLELDWLDYERARDGDLLQFLHTNPDSARRSAEVHPPGVVFDNSLRAVASSVISVTATTGVDLTVETADLSALALASGIERPRYQSPMLITGAIADDEEHIEFDFEFTYDAFLPWPPYPREYGLAPSRVYADNRHLAGLNAPRVNAFLADVRRATRLAGAEWSRSAWFAEYEFQLNDDGVRLDATPPGGVG
jgi:hypothetical protein